MYSSQVTVTPCGTDVSSAVVRALSKEGHLVYLQHTGYRLQIIVFDR